MALPPAYAGQRYPTQPGGTPAAATHTIELFLDYVCPFSAKLFNRLYHDVLPGSDFRTRHSQTTTVLLRQQIQPWHPSSTLVHEAGLAVLKLAPHRFWDFSAALFAHQAEYYDEATAAETRNATYARLAKLAKESAGVDEDEFLGLVRVKEGGEHNSGNKVTDDVKVVTKMNRLVGVHVTPTVFLNGYPNGEVGSSSSKQEWEDWMNKYLK